MSADAWSFQEDSQEMPGSKNAFTNNPATGSLVLWIFGFCAPIVGLAGIVCRHMGLSQIGKARGALNVGSVLPGFRHFVKRSSPLTHTSRLTAPVFLFFADDDEMIQAEGYRPFIAKLRETNREVTLRTVPEGGHYQSMIDEGIPAGIEWIRKNGAGLPSP